VGEKMNEPQNIGLGPLSKQNITISMPAVNPL
jgi:hypothetical protein